MVVDIYVRQSGDETEASPELQEAACREYAAAQGWEVDEVVTESNTSSVLPADQRGLGFLVQRCEAGQSAGILCRHLDRFGRSVGEGALAYKRIVDAGARLVAVADGLDSSRDGAKLQFTMLMAFAEQTYDRNRGWFLTGKERAVARGVYAAPAPFGYDRDAEGRLAPNADAAIVRQIFSLRANGLGFSEIARQVDGALTRSGVRRVVMNRAYVGEQRIPDPARRGEPKVVRDSHRPLVTHREWEAANAVTGRAPQHTGLGRETQLKGVVKCGVCGGTMHVLAYGKARDRRTYACTNRGCASMAVSKVEPAVLWQLQLAIGDREPHVGAVIEGDARYQDALAAVEQAQRDLAEYRDSIEIQRELGAAAFAAGLRVRKDAVEVARRALRETPRPEDASSDGRKMTLEEFDVADRRRFYARAIAEVRVLPRSAGEHRLRMRWTGAEDDFLVPPAPKPVDLAALVAA